jgi:hypothetical protein
MYKCEFSKLLWKDEEKTGFPTVLVKDIELPFPPYLGLEVVSGKFRSGAITSVAWNSDKEIFSVGVPEEIPWEDADLYRHTADDIESYLLTRGGWEVLE